MLVQWWAALEQKPKYKRIAQLSISIVVAAMLWVPACLVASSWRGNSAPRPLWPSAEGVVPVIGFNSHRRQLLLLLDPAL
jgi:hypothetical protein